MTFEGTLCIVCTHIEMYFYVTCILLFLTKKYFLPTEAMKEIHLCI